MARRRPLKGIVILARRMDWWADDSVVVLRWAQLSFPLAIRRLDCDECSQQLGDRLDLRLVGKQAAMAHLKQFAYG